MENLNLPAFQPMLDTGKNGSPTIFDPVRRKFVRLTPEEWVRQHFLNYLVHHLGYPPGLIVVEAQLTYNRLKKRFDILACSRKGTPLLIIECKAPSVKLTQEVVDQVAVYNMSLKVDYLVVTNGMSHFACAVDHASGHMRILDGVPSFRMLDGDGTA